MITEDKITGIFCIADDFCKYFSSELKKHQISDGKKHRNKSCKLSEAEVITILIQFHCKGFRCLKHFFVQYVCEHMCHIYPPQAVSYNHFVEFDEFESICKAWREMSEVQNRDEWERTRTLAAICIQPHIKKKITRASSYRCHGIIYRISPTPQDSLPRRKGKGLSQ